MGIEMARKRYTVEQIIRKLREAEIELVLKCTDTLAKAFGDS